MPDNNTRRGFLRSAALGGLATGLGVNAGTARGETVVGFPVTYAGGKSLAVDPRKVLLYECTRREIRERIASGSLTAAIVPTASTEQHNEHLAMCMDAAAALLVSQTAALKLYPRVIVATPVAVGVSPYWMNRKGTLTLRKETFQAMVYDICDSLRIHGFKTILVVNGHGGNAGPLGEKLAEFREKLGVTFDVCSYWDSIPQERRKEFTESGDVPGHSGEFETSIALAAFPERVRFQGVAYDPKALNLTAEELKSDQTLFEESKLASAEKGERIIAHASNWVAEKLRGMMG
jgi:creatinine amidohydrolase